MLDSQYIQQFGELNFIKDPTYGYLYLKCQVKSNNLPAESENFVLYETTDGLFYFSSFVYYQIEPEIINPAPVKLASPKEK